MGPTGYGGFLLWIRKEVGPSPWTPGLLEARLYRNQNVSPCRLIEKPELRVLPVPGSECQSVPEPARGPAACPSLPHFLCVSAARFVPAKTGLVFPESILFLENRAQFITNQKRRGQALERMEEGIGVLLLVAEGGGGSTPIGPLLLYGRENWA